MRLAVAIWCGMSGVVAAQPVPDSPTMAAAARLLSAMHYEERLRESRAEAGAMVNGAANDCRRDRVSADVCRARLKQAEQLERSVIAQRDATVPQLVDAARTAYAAHLSAEEMDQVTAFYLSPAGRKLLAELPAINVDIGAAQGRVVMQWLAKQEPVR